MAGSAKASPLMNVRRVGGSLSMIFPPFFQIAQVIREGSIVGLRFHMGFGAGSPELHDRRNCTVASNRVADGLGEILGKNICNPDRTPRLIFFTRIALEQ